MALLDPSGITPLQSATIRAALKAIAVNLASLAAVVTGKTIDLGLVNQVIDLGVPLLANLASIYFAYRTI